MKWLAAMTDGNPNIASAAAGVTANAQPLRHSHHSRSKSCPPTTSKARRRLWRHRRISRSVEARPLTPDSSAEGSADHSRVPPWLSLYLRRFGG
jgi:hypothetical protein